MTIIFNVKVYRHLRSMKNQMSMQRKETHRQISTILIVQATVPGIICLFPIALAATLTFLHTNILDVGRGMGLMFSIIPLANPLLTLSIVRNYRNTVFQNIKKYFLCFYIFKK